MRKHKIQKCNKCKCQNDITEMMESNDFDEGYKEGQILIYCIRCGQQLEVILNK